jgi:hypothetical protein
MDKRNERQKTTLYIRVALIQINKITRIPPKPSVSTGEYSPGVSA